MRAKSRRHGNALADIDLECLDDAVVDISKPAQYTTRRSDRGGTVAARFRKVFQSC